MQRSILVQNRGPEEKGQRLFQGVARQYWALLRVETPQLEAMVQQPGMRMPLGVTSLAAAATMALGRPHRWPVPCVSGQSATGPLILSSHCIYPRPIEASVTELGPGLLERPWSLILEGVGLQARALNRSHTWILGGLPASSLCCSDPGHTAKPGPETQRGQCLGHQRVELWCNWVSI